MQHNRIQKLSPLLINQIAAGEVVTRPASVVKELIENAIDAHATHIRIDIEQGGLGLIQISDNGDGIHPDDMILAVTRHATSKLADVGELAGIDSLGFRGEALASIAGVAHLTLTSSHDDTGVGRQLTLSGDDASHANIVPIVKDKGTTVSVRDLYFNVPARRNHLKNISTEFNHIEQIIQKIAISFADIQIELYHQGKQRLNLTNQTHEREYQPLIRLENCLSKNLQQDANPFYLSLNGLMPNQNPNGTSQIMGFFWLNQSNLPRLIYINKRLVTDLSISQTLQKVARKAGIEQLGYVLFFDLPNEWVNVNIHPSKQQVKIQPLSNMLAWLEQAMFDNIVVAIDKIPPTNAHYQDSEQKFHTNGLNDTQKNNDTPQPKLSQVAEPIQTYVIDKKIEVTLPIVLSILDNQGCGNGERTLVIHWQDSLYLLNLSKQSLLNSLIKKSENPVEAINQWIKQKFLQNNMVDNNSVTEWLTTAKKMMYKTLVELF